MALFKGPLAEQRRDWQRKIRLARALQPHAVKETSVAADVLRTMVEEGKMLVRHPFGYAAYRAIGMIPIVPIPDRLAARIASRLPGGFEMPLDETATVMMKRLASARGAEARQLENAFVGYADHAAMQAAEARVPVSPRVLQIMRRKYVLHPDYARQQRHFERAVAAAKHLPSATAKLVTLRHAPAAKVEIAKKRWLERKR
ncbi:MAG: hypothetical protein AB1626_05260 [Candidatus Micrarchaeota archaeon]